MTFGIGLGLFVVGVALGVWLRRDDRAARARIEELEIELVEVRAELQGHREHASKHFERASELFRDLTRDYTALYAHLAEGARELCPDRVPAIGRGRPAPLIEAAPDPDLDGESGLGGIPALPDTSNNEEGASEES